MPQSPSVARELVAHSQALRHLAKDLVGHSGAEDLVQDTAVRALRSPPAAPNALFAWLATVMRRDSARAVTDALWNLPEPYQATLVQRYFQDLSPAQIAERTTTPLATVKSRLQRGLEMLRATLGKQQGRDWRAAVVPAFGIPVHSTWLIPVLSVSSMSTLGKSVVFVAACAVAALSWWVFEPAFVPSVPVAAAGVGDREQALAVATPEIAARDREPVPASDVATMPDLAQPFAFELRCRVCDADGLPIRGANVALAPPACALAIWPQATDDDGRVVMIWRGRTRSMTVAVGLVHEGNTSLQLLRVEADHGAELGFVAGLAPMPADVHLDERGMQVVRLPECSQGKADCRACHQGIQGPDVFAVRGQVRAGLHPDASFGDRLVIPPPAQEGDEMGIDNNEWGSAVGVGSGVGSGAGSGASGREARPTVVEGRVFGADGRPVASVCVSLTRSAAPSWSFTGRTAVDGTFRVAKVVPAGTIEVRVGGGPEGLATRALEVVKAQTNWVDVVLQTGRTLRGRVVARSGAPMVGARVEYMAGPGQDCDMATVGPNGVFAFANLPPGPGRLLLWGVGGEKLPIADEPSVLPESGDVLFDMRARAAAAGTLRVFVRGHDGEPPADLEVRAWQVQTQRGTFLDRREDGAFHAHGLVAGFYRLEVGALASGFRDLGQHWVDGAGLADLGTVQLSAPGRLAIEAPEGFSGLELYARRDDLDVRADEIGVGVRELALPAGRWLALWKQEGNLVARELTLVGGRRLDLRIAR